ncbi:hypothetical protein F4810DRAFT_684202 [Camillea tinctor]|nr:hypothetical protein F4810DRAFT_684202 [Camillea tinctor]
MNRIKMRNENISSIRERQALINVDGRNLPISTYFLFIVLLSTMLHCPPVPIQRYICDDELIESIPDLDGKFTSSVVESDHRGVYHFSGLFHLHDQEISLATPDDVIVSAERQHVPIWVMTGSKMDDIRVVNPLTWEILRCPAYRIAWVNNTQSQGHDLTDIGLEKQNSRKRFVMGMHPDGKKAALFTYFTDYVTRGHSLEQRVIFN